MFKLTIAPDLQTRESVMTAAGRVQLSVTTPEGTRYIKIEAKAKQPQGSAKRYLPAVLAEATHVFISEKGYGTPSLGTYYPPKPGHDEGRFFESDHQHVAPEHIEAMQLAIAHINGAGIPADVEVVAESQCGLCGQPLRDPVSVTRGIGPECAQKPTGTKILHASVFADQQPLPEVEAQGEVLGVISDRYSVEDPNANPAPVSGDDNNADRAFVELGLDVRNLSQHQLDVLEAAMKEEIAIRASRA